MLVTTKDCFPLSRLDERLDALPGAKYFACLSFLNGYHQVATAHDDREKTAFVTELGQVQYRAMAFRIRNAPASLQRLIPIVLHVQQRQISFASLDDIILLAGDLADRVQSLRLVFNRFPEAYLKRKPSKCKHFPSATMELGQGITAEGVGPDPEKMQALNDWPIPKSAKYYYKLTRLCELLPFSHSHHVIGVGNCL